MQPTSDPQIRALRRRRLRLVGYAFVAGFAVLLAYLLLKNRPLISLAFSEQDARIYLGHVNTLSPDGNWLITWDNDAVTVANQRQAELVHWGSPGDSRYQPEGTPPPRFFWLPDSRRAITMISGSHSRRFDLYSIDAPHPLKVAFPQSIEVRALVGVGPDNRAVTLNRYLPIQEGAQNCTVTSSSLFSDLPAKSVTVNLPLDMTFREVVLSPDGKTLAWLADTYTVSEWRGMLHRMAPKLFPAPGKMHVFSLYVSPLEGAQLQYIGSQPVTPKNEPGVSRIQFTGDSRAVRFVYGMQVYSVKVR
jgi:hypothetical protein